MTNLTLEQAKKAIKDIAPWLSASLSDPNFEPCKEYKEACEAILKVDYLLNGEWREQAKIEALKTHEEIKWVAMDAGGVWKGFDVEPNNDRWFWFAVSRSGEHFKSFDLSCLNMPEVPAEQWQDTLMQVPGRT